MLRKSLLAATALVACVSTASAGTETGRPSDKIAPRFMKLGAPMHLLHGIPVVVMGAKGDSGPAHNYVAPRYPSAIFDNIDWKDKNQEWMSYYGFSILASSFCSYQSAQQHFCNSVIGFNALPFRGTGKKAKKIGVPLFTETGTATEFNVGIYSATSSGLPGKELAGGSTTASVNTTCCTQLRWVNVDIKLKNRQEYFVAVSCGKNDPDLCEGGWMMEEGGQDYFHYKERQTYNFGTSCPSGTNCHTHTYTYSSPWHQSNYYQAQGAAIIK